MVPLTPSASAPATVALTNGSSGFAAGVGVYTGSTVNGVTSVAAGATEATFDAVAGTVYHIAIDGGNGGSVGTYLLNWALAHGTVADFTGDESTDLSVFRPSNSRWYISGWGAQTFGTTGDVPVPGDYDGDGDTDIAVYRPSNRRWYLSRLAAQTFGTTGDVPLPLPHAIYEPYFGS